MPVQFTATKEEVKLVQKIALRVMATPDMRWYEHLDLIMDLEATHSNGCPLDFQKLLDAPEMDFLHDICGIHKYIDRSTGELTDCFTPRCSKPEG